ncbi:MAG: sulfur oxidation c-type cytochrome SoxA [Gammaproteobacteria bacterium]
MKKLISLCIVIISYASLMNTVNAEPESDLETIKSYFKNRFPDVMMDDYVNGVYALDENSRTQWESIEEFPPYEIDVDAGEELFNTPFANKKTYSDCFDNGGIGVKQNYPKFDQESGQVITLELAINNCRKDNGEEPLSYGKGEIASLSAYMAYTSRDETINVQIPDDPRAHEAYEDGKKFFYSRRGQLNMACSTCHMASAGNLIRADILSPALGHTSHFPVYRSKWEALGTLHRRYVGCNKQVRAKPFALQSEEYRNLEYFHTYMSNGLVINGPGSRK